MAYGFPITVLYTLDGFKVIKEAVVNMLKAVVIVVSVISWVTIEIPVDLIADTSYLYTPWRTEYKPKVKTEDSVVCHMCRMASKNPGSQDFIVLETQHFVVALNVFPYSKGHVLIIPRDHAKKMQDLSAQARAQLIELIADASTILETVFNCTGFNVGYNQAYNSGASIPEHLHIHIVPRYANKVDAFFNSISDTRLIEWDFPQLHQSMLSYFIKLRKKYAVLSSSKIKI